MIGKSDKCFSPWYGYLVILIVCIVIASAIFFEFNGSRRSRARHKRVPKVTAMQPVALPVSDEQGGIDTAKGKVLF